MSTSVPDPISWRRRKPDDVGHPLGERADFTPALRVAIIIAASLAVWTLLVYGAFSLWPR